MYNTPFDDYDTEAQIEETLPEWDDTDDDEPEDDQ